MERFSSFLIARIHWQGQPSICHRWKVDIREVGMSDVSITAASVLAGANAQIIYNGIAGATIAAGKTIYRDSNSVMQLSDSNGAAAAQAVLGIALNSASAGQPVAYATEDEDFTPGGTIIEGTVYVLSATAGGICPTTDLASGQKAIVLGVGLASNKLNLKIFAGGSVPA